MTSANDSPQSARCSAPDLRSMVRNRSQPSRQQDRMYWDRMAERWDQEIFNTLHHDRSGVIGEEIERSSRRARSIADFGCGTGIYLPLLSRLFEDVHGFERSTRCVAIARRKLLTLANVAVHSASAASVRRHGRFDVVLCVNVAVHPAPRARDAVFRAIRALLSPEGRLILVVPSLESATMVAAAEEAALRGRSEGRAADWIAGEQADGVVTIERMPYKHYTRREVGALLEGMGLAVTRIRRVEYSWRSQGVRPGPNPNGELPWDWIAVAKRLASARRDRRALPS
jgi:2-polyprenyl-3-methyl-5-hydroxy-6-metoxy-1,4-benzoquinol methylase